ncbi:D-alanyl-D-alanine carboxypeptidase/D-alanyl-D-alanine-endopeptidase [Gordonia sp. TBRC 11910]|uniref:D-alanyl-D-alanine carboxypeptidase/D-alanyl-D-alanine-endopeptidase n=1 Tax=Gordonia asplenii TaxID=2725283 RepID=A0A848L7Q5_9ACTN|nr:D-alanyl-D-alanine carboxypeptidase/D-alanyl-D-alanine-endopeptidase [Gordonia asplenii]NMO04773.1 D-alanyl-D-alanine carboxypeptidase/D-alanyl-D-alanine-endopeptidase [Gordonia asplenii]
MSARKGTRIALWIITSIAIVAVVAAASVVVYLQLNKGPDVPPGTPARPALIAASPTITPVSPDAPEPTAAGVRKALAKVAASPALGKLTGEVTDPLTGATLWSRNPTLPLIPASNTKVLTASAVLLGLPEDKRLTTTVVQGTDGQVILVGAGDPTLSAQPTGVATFFTDAPRIASLAEQIRKSGINVTAVAVDTSAFTGPTMDSTWDRGDIAGGDIAPIESLMADAGRIKPLDEFSPRVDDPAVTAGKVLADALGVDAKVTTVTADAGAKVVAQVTSAPLITRVNDMMRYSDNVMAQALSMELSKATGGDASLAGGAQAVEKTLTANGFDLTGVTLHDTSGLSYANRVPAALLDKLMSGTAGTAEPKLRPMLDGLPIAGGTGTLADRFDPKLTAGAGWVRAKTGTLTGVSSLTGTVLTVDGRVLSFALMSNGTSPADARPALDAVAGALRECGCR